MKERILRHKDYELEDKGINIILVGTKLDLYEQKNARMYLNSQKVKDLVIGYVRNAEKLWNDKSMIIPSAIRDICLSYHGTEPQGRISYEMGAELAKSWETDNFKVPFYETSALNGQNVEDVFINMVTLCQYKREETTLRN